MIAANLDMPEKQIALELNVAILTNQQALERPTALSVVAGNGRFTYRDLVRRALRLAESLRRDGFGKNDIAAILLPPSADFVVAALGILSAGGAYLPLEPAYPGQRLSFMLQDSDARALVTTPALLTKVALPDSCSMIDIASCERQSRQLSAPVDTEPDDLAYLIYTSGSTGQPKAVEILHRGLSNLVAWHNAAFSVTNKDRASQIAGLSFDAAVWEIWPYLAVGAALFVPEKCVREDPPRLRQWLIKERITVSFAPTPIAEQLIQMSWPAKSSLRLLLTGGEYLKKVPARGLPFTLVNNYGPTECTVVATSGTVHLNNDSTVVPSIGKAITNTEIYILGPDLKPTPPGVAGEICIGGPSLARGYRNHPELSAEKFIPHPFSDQPGVRLYKTGDLARVREDGELEFIGRVDNQIKIRGLRIELEEIAIAVNRHPAVRQCVVTTIGDSAGDQQLIAYLVLNSSLAVTDEDLRSFIGKSLPDFMIPSAFVLVKSLPLTQNGKVDRTALPAPMRENTLGMRPQIRPRTPVEQRVTRIVGDLLKLKDIGIEDNFFRLGGHSLLGAQLIARIGDQFGVELPLRAVFEAPTIAKLSEVIEHWGERPGGPSDIGRKDGTVIARN